MSAEDRFKMSILTVKVLLDKTLLRKMENMSRSFIISRST